MKRKVLKLVRLTEEEFAKMKFRAEQSGISDEEYIRALLNLEMPRTIPPDEYFEMIESMHEVGKALKDIAIRVQQGNIISGEEYLEKYFAYMSVVMEIQRAVTKPLSFNKDGDYKNMEG